jgi:hypothetical protein
MIPLTICILLKGEVWAQTTSLILHLLLKCLCQARTVGGHMVFGVSIFFSISTIWLFYFEIVPTVYPHVDKITQMLSTCFVRIIKDSRYQHGIHTILVFKYNVYEYEV